MDPIFEETLMPDNQTAGGAAQQQQQKGDLPGTPQYTNPAQNKN